MERSDSALDKGSFQIIDAVGLQVEIVVEHARAYGDKSGGNGWGYVWVVIGVRERRTGYELSAVYMPA